MRTFEFAVLEDANKEVVTPVISTSKRVADAFGFGIGGNAPKWILGRVWLKTTDRIVFFDLWSDHVNDRLGSLVEDQRTFNQDGTETSIPKNDLLDNVEMVLFLEIDGNTDSRVNNDLYYVVGDKNIYYNDSLEEIMKNHRNQPLPIPNDEIISDSDMFDKRFTTATSLNRYVIYLGIDVKNESDNNKKDELNKYRLKHRMNSDDYRTATTNLNKRKITQAKARVSQFENKENLHRTEMPYFIKVGNKFVRDKPGSSNDAIISANQNDKFKFIFENKTGNPLNEITGKTIQIMYAQENYGLTKFLTVNKKGVDKSGSLYRANAGHKGRPQEFILQKSGQGYKIKLADKINGQNHFLNTKNNDLTYSKNSGQTFDIIAAPP